MEFENNAYFWQKIDSLYLSSDVIIDRPKNSRHPVYDNLIYPVDYGYLKEEKNNEKIAVYIGASHENIVKSIVVCADILKRDVEVKLLVGCSNEEENSIQEFLNQTDFQKSIIIRRGQSIPKWANKE